MKTVAYCRISKDHDGRDVPGIARQRADCEAWAEANGHDLVDVFTDNLPASKRKLYRPGFESAVAAVEQGLAQAIVVWRTDRLCRRPSEGERVIEVLQDAGGELFVTTNPASGIGSTGGLLMLRIEMGVGAHETAVMSERIKRAKEQRAREGKPSGGRRRWGHIAGETEIIESEAEVIREIVQRVLAGETLGALSFELKDRGITRPNGTWWDVTGLAQTLRRPGLAGLIGYHGEVIDSGGNVPAIIDRPTYDRLMAVIGQRSRTKTRTRKREGQLLSTLLTCGVCGSRMYGERRPAPRRDTYRCLRRTTNNACGHGFIDAASSDALVTEAVVQALDTKGLSAMLQQAADEHGDGALIAERAALLDRRGQVVADYAALIIDRDPYLAALAAIDERLKRVDTSLARDAGLMVLDGVTGTIAAEWADRPLEWRRQVIRSVVESIRIMPPADGEPRGFDPRRVEIDWRA